ncbi:zinc finger, CCHC-type containing protein [Tanacetum coccineum]
MHPRKSQSEHIDEFHKLVGDLAVIDIVISDEDQALLEVISDEDNALLLLTSSPSSYDYFKMKEEKGNGGEGLYVRGRSGQIDMEHDAWSKSQERSSKLKCYTCQSEEHLKRDCPRYNHKKSQDFVKNKDQVFGSRADVMMVISVEQLLNWIMDSGGSYHMTYKRDYWFNFEEYDGGNVLLGDGTECRVRGTGKVRVQRRDGSSFMLDNVRYVLEFKRNLISLGTLEKEGFTVKMQSGMIKVIKGSLVVLSGTRRANWSCIYAVEIQEYQVVFTIPNIAPVGVGMFDGFDSGLQTNIQVCVDFDHAMGRSITIMGRSITRYGLMIQGCAGGWEAMMPHMMALSATEAEYMTLTEAVKEVIWLNGFSTELEFEPSTCTATAAKCLAGRVLSCGNMMLKGNKQESVHLDGQAVTRNTLKGRKQLGIQRHNGLVEETNMTLLAKTPINMLGFFGWLASIKQGMLEPVKVKCIFLGYQEGITGNKLWSLDDVTSKVVLCKNMVFNESWEYKKTFIGYGVGKSSMQVLQGAQFEVEPNEVTFTVAIVEKIYVLESLTFNDTVACEVIFKWKAGLKEDMDARLDVYVLSNGCKKSNDGIDGYY